MDLDRACGSVQRRNGLALAANTAANRIARTGGRAISVILSPEGLVYLELREESTEGYTLVGTYSGVLPRVLRGRIYGDLKATLGIP